MDLPLTARRVLGALMEKEMATPEQYPLSLNTLVAACNQKSSRDPVMELAEEEVRSALSFLEAEQLVSTVREGRVARFEHRIRTVLNLRRDETAVLCLLLLRGAQTPGELRGRSDRLFPFEDVTQAQATLDRLAGRPEPLVAMLPLAPGARESRYCHLLGGAAPAASAEAAERPGKDPQPGELQRLVALVEDLRLRVERLEQARGGD